VPVLKLIFNLSLSKQQFPSLWKQADIIPVFKKRSSTSDINYRPASILNNFSKVSEFIIYEHVFYYFKSKLNICQHGFTKSKTTVTNLVTYLDLVNYLVCYRSQVDAIYFNLSSASGLVPHALLLHKLTDYGLSASYVNWFHSYLTNRLSHVCYSEAFSSPFEVLSGSFLRPLLLNALIKV
jgi:hypothetical protein